MVSLRTWYNIDSMSLLFNNRETPLETSSEPHPKFLRGLNLVPQVKSYHNTPHNSHLSAWGNSTQKAASETHVGLQNIQNIKSKKGKANARIELSELEISIFLSKISKILPEIASSSSSPPLKVESIEQVQDIQDNTIFWNLKWHLKYGNEYMMITQYPDRKTFKVHSGGKTFEVHPDGRTVTQHPDGRTVTQHPDGRTVTLHPDERTVELHLDGMEVTLHPDGMKVTKFPYSQEFPYGRTVVEHPSWRKFEVPPDGMTDTQHPEYSDQKVNAQLTVEMTPGGRSASNRAGTSEIEELACDRDGQTRIPGRSGMKTALKNLGSRLLSKNDNALTFKKASIEAKIKLISTELNETNKLLDRAKLDRAKSSSPPGYDDNIIRIALDKKNLLKQTLHSYKILKINTLPNISLREIEKISTKKQLEELFENLFDLKLKQKSFNKQQGEINKEIKILGERETIKPVPDKLNLISDFLTPQEALEALKKVQEFGDPWRYDAKLGITLLKHASDLIVETPLGRSREYSLSKFQNLLNQADAIIPDLVKIEKNHELQIKEMLDLIKENKSLKGFQVKKILNVLYFQKEQYLKERSKEIDSQSKDNIQIDLNKIKKLINSISSISDERDVTLDAFKGEIFNERINIINSSKTINNITDKNFFNIIKKILKGFDQEDLEYFKSGKGFDQEDLEYFKSGADLNKDIADNISQKIFTALEKEGQVLIPILTPILSRNGEGHHYNAVMIQKTPKGDYDLTYSNAAKGEMLQRKNLSEMEIELYLITLETNNFKNAKVDHLDKTKSTNKIEIKTLKQQDNAGFIVNATRVLHKAGVINDEVTTRRRTWKEFGSEFVGGFKNTGSWAYRFGEEDIKRLEKKFTSNFTGDHQLNEGQINNGRSLAAIVRQGPHQIGRAAAIVAGRVAARPAGVLTRIWRDSAIRGDLGPTRYIGEKLGLVSKTDENDQTENNNLRLADKTMTTALRLSNPERKTININKPHIPNNEKTLGSELRKSVDNLIEIYTTQLEILKENGTSAISLDKNKNPIEVDQEKMNFYKEYLTTAINDLKALREFSIQTGLESFDDLDASKEALSKWARIPWGIAHATLMAFVTAGNALMPHNHTYVPLVLAYYMRNLAFMHNLYSLPGTTHKDMVNHIRDRHLPFLIPMLFYVFQGVIDGNPHLELSPDLNGHHVFGFNGGLGEDLGYGFASSFAFYVLMDYALDLKFPYGMSTRRLMKKIGEKIDGPFVNTYDLLAKIPITVPGLKKWEQGPIENTKIVTNKVIGAMTNVCPREGLPSQANVKIMLNNPETEGREVEVGLETARLEFANHNRSGLFDELMSKMNTAATKEMVKLNKTIEEIQSMYDKATNPGDEDQRAGDEDQKVRVSTAVDAQFSKFRGAAQGVKNAVGLLSDISPSSSRVSKSDNVSNSEAKETENPMNLNNDIDGFVNLCKNPETFKGNNEFDKKLEEIKKIFPNAIFRKSSANLDTKNKLDFQKIIDNLQERDSKSNHKNWEKLRTFFPDATLSHLGECDMGGFIEACKNHNLTFSKEEEENLKTAFSDIKFYNLDGKKLKEFNNQDLIKHFQDKGNEVDQKELEKLKKSFEKQKLTAISTLFGVTTTVATGLQKDFVGSVDFLGDTVMTLFVMFRASKKGPQEALSTFQDYCATTTMANVSQLTTLFTAAAIAGECAKGNNFTNFIQSSNAFLGMIIPGFALLLNFTPPGAAANSTGNFLEWLFRGKVDLLSAPVKQKVS